MSVDIGNLVITDIAADFADKKDAQCLQPIVTRFKKRLLTNGLLPHNVLAGTGYSSGDNYAFFEQLNITAFIPPHGKYKGGPDGLRSPIIEPNMSV